MNEDLFFLGVKALVTRSDGNILVLQLNKDIRSPRNPDGWDIPGGRIKQGETIEQVLKREVKEEAGLDASDFSLFTMAPTPIRLKASDKDVGLIFGIYEASIPANTEPQLGDEHEAFEWVTPKEAAKRLAPVFPPELIKRLESA